MANDDGLILIGILAIVHRDNDRVRPTIAAQAWHPVVGRFVSVTWPDRGNILNATVRLDKASGGPGVVRLDPRFVADHNRVILDHEIRTRRWLHNGLCLTDYQAPRPEPIAKPKRPGRPRKQTRSTPLIPARHRSFETHEMTLSTLPPEVPVLVGRLVFHRHGPIKGKPALSSKAWCCHCRDDHQAPWPEPPFELDAVVTMPAPCQSGPLKGGTIALALDQTLSTENRKVVRGFQESIRRWAIEQKFKTGQGQAWSGAEHIPL